MDTLDDSGENFSIATTFIIAGVNGNAADPNCDAYGSLSNPIYVVVQNNSLDDLDSTAEAHVTYHETAHALGINDTTQACWADGFIVYPLMHNSFPEVNCHDAQQNPWRYLDNGSYTLLNYWATANEKQAVKDRNSW